MKIVKFHYLPVQIKIFFLDFKTKGNDGRYILIAIGMNFLINFQWDIQILTDPWDRNASKKPQSFKRRDFKTDGNYQ